VSAVANSDLKLMANPLFVFVWEECRRLQLAFIAVGRCYPSHKVE